MSKHAFSLSGGAKLKNPERTLFRIWAPDLPSVNLEIADSPSRPMQAESDGWFSLEVACGAGTRYRYGLAPDLHVPDPFSRGQSSDVNGDSIVVDPAAYDWRNQAWTGRPWQEAVIYEAHAGLLGGFGGLMGRLPSLASLGITAIELMPIADFSGRRNWGYDGVLPFAPDRSYGTPADLKALIDRAHDLNLMVFLDVVYNHFGPEGNYLSHYAAPFFRENESTPWGKAIDFRNPIVRRYFIENALYWLEEYQFDGLRLDAVHAISPRDWLLELARAVRQEFAGRHIHLMLENDNNDAALLENDYAAQWNDDGHHVLHALLTGEAAGYYAEYADCPAEKLARCLAEGFIFQGEVSSYRDGRHRGSSSIHLSPYRFILFLQNHDQIGNRAFGERLTELVDPQRLRVAVALVLLSPQIPLLFMGEEIGSAHPFLFFTDYTGDLAVAVRDGRRREFAHFPAFSQPEAQMQIPDPNAEDSFNRSAPYQDGDESEQSQGWKDLYHRLLKIRHKEIVPRLQSAKSIGAKALSPAAVEAKWLLGDGLILILSVNFSDSPMPYSEPSGKRIYHSENIPAAILDNLPAQSCLAILQDASDAQ